jgi:hypothetical protein
MKDTQWLLSMNEARGWSRMIGSIDCACTIEWRTALVDNTSITLDTTMTQQSFYKFPWRTCCDLKMISNFAHVPRFIGLPSGHAPACNFIVNVHVYDMCCCISIWWHLSIVVNILWKWSQILKVTSNSSSPLIPSERHWASFWCVASSVRHCLRSCSLCEQDVHGQHHDHLCDFLRHDHGGWEVLELRVREWKYRYSCGTLQEPGSVWSFSLGVLEDWRLGFAYSASQ